MASLRNICFTIALVALGLALFLFARGLTTYAYISAVIVPLSAMMAIVFQPGRGRGEDGPREPGQDRP